MPAPSTVEEFLEIGRKSGILEKQALDAYVHQMREQAAVPGSPAKLARRMVKDGLLTNLQAELFLQGKWRKFLISGKYVLLERLGSGGMGTVFLCQHKVMRRKVAIKVLPAKLAQDKSIVDRFHREARAAAQLDHPNIVRAHDIDQDADMHFLVMEYVNGNNLEQIVQRRGPMDALRATHYIYQTALGLQHAHEAGLVHRDIKPGNLLLDRTGTVKILDMGLARFFNEDQDNLTRQHDSQCVLGTADYLAPEQAIDSHGVDIRADIYSLGVTFYFLLTGKSPFQEGTLAQKLLWHQMRAPRPVREIRPELSAELAGIIDQMMAKAPADRFQTPLELAEALAPFVQEPIAPPPEEEMPGLCPALRGPDSTMSSVPRSHVAMTPSLPPRSSPGSAAIMTKPRSAAARARDSGPRLSVPDILLKGWRSPTKWAAAACIALTVCGLGLAVWSILANRPSKEDTPEWRKASANASGPGPWKPQPQPPKVENKPIAHGPGEVRQFTVHTSAVESLAVSPDGRRLLTGSQDKTMCLWELPSTKVLHMFQDFGGTVYCVGFSPDGRQAVSACADGSVRLWDVDKRTEIRRLDGHSRTVSGAAFSPDGRSVVSGGDDQTVRVWDAATGRQLTRCMGHTQGVWYVAWSPDGCHVLSAGKDATIRLWDATTGVEVRRFVGHQGEVRRVAFSPDGLRILSGGFDGTLRLWETATGRLMRTLDGGGCIVESAQFSPGGRLAYATEGPKTGTQGRTVGPDHGFRIWDLSSGRQLHRLGGVAAKVFQLALIPETTQALTVSSDRQIRLWQLPVLTDDPPLVRCFKSAGAIERLAVSPNGQYALSVGPDRAARLWNLHSGKEVRRLEGHTSSVHGVAIAGDNRHAVTTGNDQVCQIWDIETGVPLRRFMSHRGRVWAAAFLPDGQHVLTAGADGTARLWHMVTGDEVRVFTGHTGQINSVAVSLDGRRALTAGWDKVVILWDLATGAEIRRFTEHTAEARTVAFLPDGRRALSAGSDRVLRLWDVETSQGLRTLPGHPGPVWAVAVSRDGRLAASGGPDKIVRVWDLETGQSVIQLGGHTEQIAGLAFTPDAKQLVSGSHDKTVRVWRVPGR
jgi:WD40 repeat protein